MFIRKKHLYKILDKIDRVAQNDIDKIYKNMAFERFYRNQTSGVAAVILKNHFVLLHNFNNFINPNGNNLGDEIQVLATKKALDATQESPSYEYATRDNLAYYNGGGGFAIMQGWFAHDYHFLPPKNILPIFVGTHFTAFAQDFLRFALVRYPSYFRNKIIGCRDLFTLNFCQSIGVKAYFSRCLTLTLPKREPSPNQNKVFFTNLHADFLPFIPQELKDKAENINQRAYVFDEQILDANHHLKAAAALLARYKNEAKLVITSALHCAAPCVAMGIPVILYKHDSEQDTRFSALDGILPIYTRDDFKKGRVNFSPNALDIEVLKGTMLENLRLSIKEAQNEAIDTKRLSECREFIRNFKI